MVQLGRFGKLLLAAVCAATVGACAPLPDGPGPAPISFSGMPPLFLDVGRIDFDNRYRSPAAAPNVEHLLIEPPATVVRGWVRDRLHAAGGSGALRVTLHRADVVETRLAPEGGLRGLFTTEQTERYDAVIGVSLEILDAAGESRSRINAEVRRSRTIAEDVSVNERRVIWHEMLRALAGSLDRTVEDQVRKHFGDWLQRPRN